MLVALGLLALVGLWWLGRSGGRLRLPRPPHLAAYALLLGAGLLLVRGNPLAALALAAGGLWLLEGVRGPVRGFVGALAAARARQRPGGRLRTAAVVFEIEPDGRPADGLVRLGPLAGRRLAGLAPVELAGLWRLCRPADPAAAALLEAYLDRRHPRWRVDAERDPHAGPGRAPQPGAMSQEEAYQILGLERGASGEEIRAAHRTLMKRAHPDQGGTAGAAARLNAARDRLTDRHR